MYKNKPELQKPCRQDCVCKRRIVGVVSLGCLSPSTFKMFNCQKAQREEYANVMTYHLQCNLLNQNQIAGAVFVHLQFSMVENQDYRIIPVYRYFMISHCYVLLTGSQKRRSRLYWSTVCSPNVFMMTACSAHKIFSKRGWSAPLFHTQYL